MLGCFIQTKMYTLYRKTIIKCHFSNKSINLVGTQYVCLSDMVLIYAVVQKRNKFIEPDRNEHSLEDANIRGSLE